MKGNQHGTATFKTWCAKEHNKAGLSSYPVDMKTGKYFGNVAVSINQNDGQNKKRKYDLKSKSKIDMYVQSGKNCIARTLA